MKKKIFVVLTSIFVFILFADVVFAANFTVLQAALYGNNLLVAYYAGGGSVSVVQSISAGCDDPASVFSMGTLMHFTNITVPRGAQIVSGYLILTSNETIATATVNTRLRAELTSNNSTLFSQNVSEWYDFPLRVWTTAYTNWDSIGNWNADAEYSSPDISSSIQEVINLPDWTSGNTMNILWDDFERRSTQAIDTYRSAYAYQGPPNKTPKLYIEYLLPPPPPNVDPETIRNLTNIIPIVFVSVLIIVSLATIAMGNILVGLISLTISIVLSIAFLSELLSIIASMG